MRTSDVTQLMDLALGLWFPFVRIMAFLRYMPVLDNSALTARVRIILSLALAIIITPLIPHPIPHDLLSLNSLILTVEQILWGMLFGLMFQFLFLALQLVGQILSFNMGMSMAVMNDPSSGASTTVLAELINVYAILLFFAMDGHLLLVSVLYKVSPTGRSATRCIRKPCVPSHWPLAGCWRRHRCWRCRPLLSC